MEARVQRVAEEEMGILVREAEEVEPVLPVAAMVEMAGMVSSSSTGSKMRHAIVINATVANIVILAQQAWWGEGNAIPLLDGESVEIGQSYDAAANPRFFGDVPRPPQSWTAYEFLLRFTAAERAAFRAAAATDAQVADFQQLAQAAQEIRSDDPMTLAGMDYLVSVALLSSDRRAEILGL